MSEVTTTAPIPGGMAAVTVPGFTRPTGSGPESKVTGPIAGAPAVPAAAPQTAPAGATAPAQGVPATPVAPAPNAAPGGAETPPAPAAAPPDFATVLERAVGAQVGFLDKAQRAEAAAEAAARENAELKARLAQLDAARGNAQGLRTLMQSLGWDDDSYVAALAANDPKAPANVRMAQLEQEQAQLKAALAERDRQAQQREIATQRQAYAQAAFGAVHAEKDRFPTLLRMFDAPTIAEYVTRQAEEMHRGSGGSRAFSPSEAATALEANLAQLVSRATGSANGVTASATQPAAPAAPAQPAPVAAPRTITNDLAASTDHAPAAPNDAVDVQGNLRRAAQTLANSQLGFTYTPR